MSFQKIFQDNFKNFIKKNFKLAIIYHQNKLLNYLQKIGF